LRWFLPALLAGFPPATGANANPGAAPPPGEVGLRADVVRIDPDTSAVEAAGDVVVEIDDAVLRAEAVEFDPATGRLTFPGAFELTAGGRTIRGDGLVLDLFARTLEISGPRLLESGLRVSGAAARCEAGACVVEDAGATPCPEDPPACGLNARRVTLHPSGDLDLEGPRLVLGETTVAGLPWLRLRPPGSSGLLPPRLGWSPTAGPIIGAAGQVALGDRGLAGGHFAARGISGYESASTFDFEAGELRLDHLFDTDGGHHGRLRFGLAPPLRGARLAVAGDLVTGGAIIDETTPDPAERAIGHTNTRLLLSSGGPEFAVETHAALLQWLDGPGEPRRVLGPRTGIRLSLPLLAWELPLWPGLELALHRMDSPSAPFAPDAAGAPAPAHTRLEARPSVEFSRRLTLLEASLRAGTAHQVWLPDGPANESVQRHAAGISARLGLPFEGFFGGVRHGISPVIAYGLVAPLHGEAPTWIVDSRDLPAGGQGVDVALINDFGDPGRPAFSVALRQRLHLPGFGADAGPAWADLRAGGGPSWLRLDLDAALDQRLLRPSLLRASLSSRDGRGTGLTTAAAWYGPGLGPHLEPSLAVLGGAETGAWPLALPIEALELIEQASVALGRHVLIHGGVRVGVVPQPALHGLWYGLRLRSSCGCAAVGLAASHRPATPVPDVLLTLALFEM